MKAPYVIQSTQYPTMFRTKFGWSMALSNATIFKSLAAAEKELALIQIDIDEKPAKICARSAARESKVGYCG